MSYFQVLSQLRAVHQLQVKGGTPARRESLRQLEAALVAALHKLKN
jgi:hypothetical protein